VVGTAVGRGAVGGDVAIVVYSGLGLDVVIETEGRTGGPSRLQVATRVKSRLLEPRLFSGSVRLAESQNDRLRLAGPTSSRVAATLV